MNAFRYPEVKPGFQLGSDDITVNIDKHDWERIVIVYNIDAVIAWFFDAVYGCLQIDIHEGSPESLLK
jgi:hypothetical protein